MDKLITALNDMHAEMAHRNNASSVILRSMAELGKPLNDSIAAALLTLDTIHAPIYSACETWRFRDSVRKFHFPTKRYAGFGSSWYKGVPDPEVEKFINILPPEMILEVDQLQEDVSELTGKKLFPNAAMATAMAANVLGLTDSVAMSLVIKGRLDVWVSIYQGNYVPRNF